MSVQLILVVESQEEAIDIHPSKATGTPAEQSV